VLYGRLEITLHVTLRDVSCTSNFRMDYAHASFTS